MTPNARWHLVLVAGCVVWMLDETPAIGAKVAVFSLCAIAAYWSLVGLEVVVRKLWPEPAR